MQTHPLSTTSSQEASH